MARSLPKDRQLDQRELGLFVQVDGILSDPYVVELQITNDSSAYGAVVLPVAGGWSDVTTDGEVSTGVFCVYDAVAADRWTPDTAIATGRVRWRYKIESTDDYTYVERHFEVVAATVTQQPADHLCLVQDLIDAGATGITSRAMWLSIRDWTQRALAVTEQPLWPVWKAKRLYARYGEGPFLPTPLYGLSTYFIEGEGEDTDNDTLLVFGSTGPERKNPRIEMADNVRPYFSDSLRRVTTVTGVWGYFEEDTYEPPDFLRSTFIAALADALMYRESKPPEIGPIKREQTDAHEVEFAVVASKVRNGWLSLLKSPEFREALEACRRPISIAITGGS